MAHRRRPGRHRSRRKITPPPGGARTKPAAAAPAEAPRQDPLVGRVIGRCHIQEVIGQGRTARVYRARHEALHTTVAVKVLLPRSASNPQIVTKFETEARAIAKIDNENVLKIYDVGAEGKLHYLVMELLEGDEVLDILGREGPFDVLDAMRVTRQAANGLAAAHAQGIVHRDVKPQNLVLLEDGTVKVVDFGLAGVTESAQGRVGTPHFMAPETCESGVTTTQSDVYSLGVTLYHMLVGEPPYAGQDVPSILKSHVRGEPLRPERKRPALPDEVSDLVRRLTQKDPAARPAAMQVVEAIDRFGGDAMQEKATLRRRRRRRRAGAAPGQTAASGAPLVIAICLVVGIIAAVIALGSSGKDESRTGPKEKSALPSTPSIPYVPATPATPTPGLPGGTVPPVDVTPPGPGPEPTPPEVAPDEDAETAGNKALFEAEQWARRNWKTQEDDERVIAEYRKVVSEHPGTAAAKEADQRIRDIRAKKIHAHPDKTFAEAADVEAAKAAWNEALPKVEEMITQHAYVSARGLVPPDVQDGASPIGKELVFWRGFLTHLVQFKNALITFAPKLPESRRQIDTPRGKGLVEKLSPQYITVRIDGKPENLLWTDIQPAALASLGRKAFQEAGLDEYVVYTMAFAFAHRLWEAFWEADFDLSMADGVDASDFMVREYKRRVEERRDSTTPPGGD